MTFYAELKRIGVSRSHPSGDDLLAAVESQLRTLERLAERVGFADGVENAEDGTLREQQVDASSLFEPFTVALRQVDELLSEVGGGPRPDVQADFLRKVHVELLGRYTRGFNRGVKAGR